MNKPDRFTVLTQGSFTYLTDGQVGAVDSAHEVFFGRLKGHEVAVKPHISMANARHEETMLQHVRDLGFSALTPLRIVSDLENDEAFLVTARLSKMISAASLTFDGPKSRVRDTTDSLTDVSRTLANLNAAGVSHGDSQIKNFGLASDTLDPLTQRPKIVVYDLEKGGRDATSHIKTEPYSHDLASLTQSLAYKGYGGADINLAADVIEESILNPYHDEAVRAGMDSHTVSDITTYAYGKFLDKRDELRFASSHSGHGRKS